jgi:hypothetical protein
VRNEDVYGGAASTVQASLSTAEATHHTEDREDLLDDIGSSALIGAWIVFEFIIKDRTQLRIEELARNGPV